MKHSGPCIVQALKSCFKVVTMHTQKWFDARAPLALKVRFLKKVFKPSPVDLRHNIVVRDVGCQTNWVAGCKRVFAGETFCKKLNGLTGVAITRLK